MSKSDGNGRSIEFAVYLKIIDKYKSHGLFVKEIQSNSLENIKNKFNQNEQELQNAFMISIQPTLDVYFKNLNKIYPDLFTENKNYTISVMPDNNNPYGVADIVLSDAYSNFLEPISLKHNNYNIKSYRVGKDGGVFSRIGEKIITYSEIKEFSLIPQELKTDDHRWKNDLNENIIKQIYKGLIDFIFESMTCIYSDESCRSSMNEDIFGSHDYRVLKIGDKIDNVIENYNFYETLLNCLPIKFPGPIYDYDIINDNEIIFRFCDGWDLSFRIHTDGRIKKNPSLKVEVKIIKQPEITIWK